MFFPFSRSVHKAKWVYCLAKIILINNDSYWNLKIVMTLVNQYKNICGCTGQIKHPATSHLCNGYMCDLEYWLHATFLHCYHHQPQTFTLVHSYSEANKCYHLFCASPMIGWLIHSYTIFNIIRCPRHIILKLTFQTSSPPSSY